MDSSRRSGRLSRRVALERNLARMRSSGRVKAVTPAPDAPTPGALRAMVPDLGKSDGAEVRQELRDLKRLHEVIHFLGGAPDLATLEREVLDLGVSVSGLVRGLLALRVPGDRVPGEGDGAIRYKVRARRGFEEGDRGAESKLLRGILNRTLEARETLLEGDILDEGILGHARGKSLHLGAVAALPLEAGGELLGALLLDDPERRRPFSPAEQSLLRSFAKHAAQALLRVAEAERGKRRLERMQRRIDRLEVERDDLRKLADQARAGARSARTGSALEAAFETPYPEAKAWFTRQYLTEALRRAGGNLLICSQATGLPMARLIGLLHHLEIEPQASGSGVGWGDAARR